MTGARTSRPRVFERLLAIPIPTEGERPGHYETSADPVWYASCRTVAGLPGVPYHQDGTRRFAARVRLASKTKAMNIRVGSSPKPRGTCSGKDFTMRAKSGVLIATTLVGMGAMIWQMSTARAVSVQEIAGVSRAVVSGLLADGDAEAAYVGNKKCKTCHFKQNKSWKKTPHAKALDILKPGNSAEAKQAHGLDPNKDYTTEAKCVKCHVTGLGHAGGYTIGGDEKKMKYLVGVGCEMCHGAGAPYVDLHKKIMKEKKPYTQAEMHAAGMVKIDADTCKKCHNEESPTFDASNPFDYEERLKTGVHEHIDLKYRQP